VHYIKAEIDGEIVHLQSLMILSLECRLSTNSCVIFSTELLEDTSGSTQKQMPADSINTTTIVLAK
jgi:hypothetical protein